MTFTHFPVTDDDAPSWHIDVSQIVAFKTHGTGDGRGITLLLQGGHTISLYGVASDAVLGHLSGPPDAPEGDAGPDVPSDAPNIAQGKKLGIWDKHRR